MADATTLQPAGDEREFTVEARSQWKTVVRRFLRHRPAMISLFVAVIGSWFAAITILQFSSGDFFQALFVFLRKEDFFLCAIKSFCFGASIPVISATLGFRCKFGAEGVGLSTTDAVVTNSIWIIILDFILTYVFSVAF